MDSPELLLSDHLHVEFEFKEMPYLAKDGCKSNIRSSITSHNGRNMLRKAQVCRNTNVPRYEKTGFLHMRNQRRRSAAPLFSLLG